MLVQGPETFCYVFPCKPFPPINRLQAKFVDRYEGRKLERARELFEQCLDKIPAKFAKPIFLLYASFEEVRQDGENCEMEIMEHQGQDLQRVSTVLSRCRNSDWRDTPWQCMSGRPRGCFQKNVLRSVAEF